MDKQQFQERVQGVMQDVELDEATRHQECPDDTTGAAMFHIRSGISGVTQNARRVFRMDDAYNRYDMKVSLRQFNGKNAECSFWMTPARYHYLLSKGPSRNDVIF